MSQHGDAPEKIIKMPDRYRSIVIALDDRFPQSDLRRVPEEEIAALEVKYSNFPKDLAMLFRTVGTGRIGDSRYMIHLASPPSTFLSPDRAAKLDSYIIVGDDFAGGFEVYDTREWRFGTFGYKGKFEIHTKYSNFTEFIEDWYCTAP